MLQLNTKKNLRAVYAYVIPFAACQRTPKLQQAEDLSFFLSQLISESSVSLLPKHTIQLHPSLYGSVSSSISSSSSSSQSIAASSGFLLQCSASCPALSSQPEAPVSSAPSSEAVSDTGSDALSAPLPVSNPNTNPGYIRVEWCHRAGDI